MDPSTEQLVRDYLNQVAVAARRSMGPDEVRAFLARLHGSIERQCTAQGVASMAEVSSVLAELGGPEALVDLERARLAADAAGPGSAGPDRGAGGPVAADPAAAEMQAAAAGTEPGATGAEDGPAGGAGGRILRLPTPRRLARQRDGWRTAGTVRSSTPCGRAGLASQPPPGSGPGPSLALPSRAPRWRSCPSRRLLSRPGPRPWPSFTRYGSPRRRPARLPSARPPGRRAARQSASLTARLAHRPSGHPAGRQPPGGHPPPGWCPPPG